MWTAAVLWLGALAIAGAAALHVLAGGAPAWAMALALAVAYFGAVLGFVASYFALAWLCRSPRPPGARIPARAAAALFWREYATVCGSAPRMMLYRRLVPDPPPAPAELPVLLLHGVLCNAGVWARFARFLAAQGVAPVYALSYGPPLASIELFAVQTAAKIEAIRAATGAAQVVIVAHSMGGLVARAYLRSYGGERVRRVITIGTPHAGSVHAYLAPGTAMAQLRPGNAWLARLPPPDPAVPPPIVSLWSWHDSMVAPQVSSVLTGAANVAFAGIGHNALLGDARIFARALEEIRRA